jgi:hypothetical protein
VDSLIKVQLGPDHAMYIHHSSRCRQRAVTSPGQEIHRHLSPRAPHGTCPSR